MSAAVVAMEVDPAATDPVENNEETAESLSTLTLDTASSDRTLTPRDPVEPPSTQRSSRKPKSKVAGVQMPEATGRQVIARPPRDAKRTQRYLGEAG